MKKVYLNNFKTESEVIAYGHNPSYKSKTQILKKFNLKKDDFYLIIGRMIPDNNADFILSQFLKSSSKKK